MGMTVLCYRPKGGFYFNTYVLFVIGARQIHYYDYGIRHFRVPFFQMLTDLDEIWQGSVVERNTLVGSI